MEQGETYRIREGSVFQVEFKYEYAVRYIKVLLVADEIVVWSCLDRDMKPLRHLKEDGGNHSLETDIDQLVGVLESGGAIEIEWKDK